jgi:DNA-binding NtrC family response regulator
VKESCAKVKSVLVVDDDKGLIFLMSILFGDAGLSVVTASSLSEVQSKFAEASRCQLAILDINLGPNEPTGIDVYLFLKKSEFAGEVVFFTGHARWHPEVVRALEFPGVKVVEKPCPSSHLLRLVGLDEVEATN